MRLKNKEKIEVFLTVANKNCLKARSKELGVTMSEIVKRLLEEYFKK